MNTKGVRNSIVLYDMATGTLHNLGNVGFSGVSDIYKIAEEMQKLNYSDSLINKILFENAHNFFIKNI
jgi:hypothetical protein